MLQTIGVSIYKGITLLQVDPKVLMNYSVFNHDLRTLQYYDRIERTVKGALLLRSVRFESYYDRVERI